MKKKKVLCFSATCFSGHEYKDLELVKELKNDFEVTYVVKSQNMFLNYRNKKKRSKISFLKKLFFKNLYDEECGFPGFENNLKQDKKFIECKTIWIDKWSELKKLIKKNDIIILGTYRNATWLVKYIRSMQKIVLIHKNPSTIDIDSIITPNILCLKDKNEKVFIERLILKKKLLKLSSEDKIKVTGTVQHSINNKQFDKADFFKKYNLDINKKLFLFLPTGPQHHNKYYQSNYIEICRTISKKYNILIKGHPTDYAKRKLPKEYNGQSSWEKLLPEIHVCKAEDFYSAIIYSTAAISIYTTAFFEINQFGKPIIFVNRFENYAYLMLKKEIDIPDYIYDKNLHKKKYDFDIKFLELIKKNLNYDIEKNEFYNSCGELKSKLFDFYGSDIKLKNLDSFIDNLDNNDQTNQINILEKQKNISLEISNTLKEYLKNSKKNNLNNIVQNKIKILLFKLLNYSKI